MTPDAYQYYLKLGPLKNTQGEKLYNNKVKIWNEYLQHDTYDAYWKARNIRPHLQNVKPAVLVVGGMFDAEDMFGAQRTYEAIEKQSATNENHVVLGPWSHGAWGRPEWTKFGQYSFGKNVNADYQKWETDFFNFFLKGKGQNTLPEATIFFTGTNEWKTFDNWPVKNVNQQTFLFHSNNKLSEKDADKETDAYVSDPANPVPYIGGIFSGRKNEYLASDQKFASKRADVLTYVTEPLMEDETIAGRIKIALQVSLDGMNGNTQQMLDADFVVKVIDVVPDSGSNQSGFDIKNDGLQRMVRADVFRGKFRNSFEKPEGFKPGKKSDIKFELNDAAHTFLKGHRIMVQVQSSWFPIVDRNPQKFMKIVDATESDFQPVKVTLHHDGSKVVLPVLQN
jgi:putative CocE/NonD family hydrolase